MLAVEILQSFSCNMRIYLRSRYIGVAEQELNYPKIRSVIQQMSRKCMTKGMRRYLLFDAGDKNILSN